MTDFATTERGSDGEPGANELALADQMRTTEQTATLENAMTTRVDEKTGKVRATRCKSFRAEDTDPELMEALMAADYSHLPSRDAWQAMDDWCARQAQALLDRSNEQILAGVNLSDPEYRCLLGQSQAFGRMRSFIHQCRRLVP